MGLGHTTDRPRIRLRSTVLLAAGTGLAAAGALAAVPASAATSGPPVVSAEGDAYAVQAQAFVLGQSLSRTPVQVGPIAPSLADVPPGTSGKGTTGTVQFNSGGQQPVVDYANAVIDNSAAAMSPDPQATSNCFVPPQAAHAPFIQTGPFTGGNGCSAIAQVGALNAGTGSAPADTVVASGIEAQSVTESCATAPQGFVDIARLAVGGTDIIGGTSPVLGANSGPIAPNTQVPLPGMTIVLNEQRLDENGHGMTVNAIHVFTSAEIGAVVSADIVIGHAHSFAMCTTGTTPTTNPPDQHVPVVTKTDSTKHADPGEVFTYAIAVAANGCNVTRVTDILPPTFTYHGASGGLGAPTAVGTYPGTQQVELDWFDPTGFTAAQLSTPETLTVQVGANAAPGLYTNLVTGQSAPPIGSTGCGQFAAEDTLPLSTGAAANQGTNPGVIVPRPPLASTAVATSVQAAQAPRPTSLPDTAAARNEGAAGLSALVVLALAGAPAVVRRRRRSRP